MKTILFSIVVVAMPRVVMAAEASGGNLSASGTFDREHTRASAGAGAFLPLSQSAVVEGQRGYTTGLGGYDTARGEARFEASAEIRLWGPIALRAGAVYANESRTLRPAVGARAQLFHEGRHGVDGAIGVFYRPEGLTEPEGEIETIVSVARHVGPLYLVGNLAYGQDPEGNERDGETRLAALTPVGSRAMVGFDGRWRFNLGSKAATLALHHEATMDVLLGPSASVFVGPFALLAHGGGSAVQMAGGAATKYGVFFMAGAGTAF